MTLVLRAVFFLIGILSICISIQNAVAQEPSEDLERQVKSAYIFKFGNYIVWPDKTFADASSPIVIGIVEDHLTADELEKIAKDHLTGNRPAVIKRLSSKNLSADVHILYVASDATKFINLYQNAHPQSPTLYITDTVEGLSSGSIINFVRDNNRLRFDVSMTAAEQNQIKLDASLLTVARQVIR